MTQFRIQKTQPEQLEEVLTIYERARQFMAAHGNPRQWGTKNPPESRIRQDIAEGNSYVCMFGDEIAAVFYYRWGDDPTYGFIDGGAWLNGKPYGVVHRIASRGNVKGAGSFCVNWAFEQCGNVKIDTHRDNVVMQNMLKKNGFVFCGIIYLENGDERLAFQKG